MRSHAILSSISVLFLFLYFPSLFKHLATVLKVVCSLYEIVLYMTHISSPTIADGLKYKDIIA
jgi:hypothetical protein